MGLGLIDSGWCALFSGGMVDTDEAYRVWVRNVRNWSWHLVLVAALMLGLGKRVSIDYHTLLKLAVCASFAIWAMGAHGKGARGWRNLFVVVAVLFNPFFPIRLMEAWPLVYVFTAAITLAGGVVGHERLTDPAGVREEDAVLPAKRAEG